MLVMTRIAVVMMETTSETVSGHVYLAFVAIVWYACMLLLYAPLWQEHLEKFPKGVLSHAPTYNPEGDKIVNTMPCYKQCDWIQFVLRRTTIPLLLHEIVCIRPKVVKSLIIHRSIESTKAIFSEQVCI